jgi:DNA-binding beta-propeller fold protein YncE/mono/diheme cytochrome c family protein
MRCLFSEERYWRGLEPSPPRGLQSVFNSSQAPLWGMICVLLSLFQSGVARSAPVPEKRGSDKGWFAPVAIEPLGDGSKVLIASARGRRVDECDLASGQLRLVFKLPQPPSGMALDREHHRLYVTCGGAEGVIFEADLAARSTHSVPANGHTPAGPLLSRDGRLLFFCLRFNNQVVVWDRVSRKELRRIPVGREPVGISETPDGKFLFVVHHLPSGRADAPVVAATIGLVDIESGLMIKELPLPNGASLAREVRLSPDGRFAVVTHNIARYQVPTTQLERGWMNTSALTILDVEAQSVLGTLLLDAVDRGAANPWAIAWSPVDQRLLVTHAGTHELSRIDFPGVLSKLKAAQRAGTDSRPDPADDLSFLVGLRDRVKLSGNGPRSMAVAAGSVVVANYFSDSIDVLDTSARPASARSIALHPGEEASELHRGEQFFNDATLCFQQWQSCASCHSSDARVDGFNWDLLNDGIGNPKNVKSLVHAHRTPPAMSMGVRYTAEAAVRAGLQHILFAVPTEAVASPIDQWLRSLEPAPSPFLVRGRLSAAASRGRSLFNSARTGCASCHKPPLFTDLQSYDVGTTANSRDADHSLDTPGLTELWRTAPYLHDGSAATLRDVLTTRNPEDQHGTTSRLSKTELDDLIEYLQSL